MQSLRVFAASKGWSRTGKASISSEAFALGACMGVGATCCFFVPNIALRPFFVYVAVVALYHMTEFLSSAVYHPDDTSITNFLIPHSPEYSMAMGASVLEYLLEYWLGYTLTKNALFFYLGLIVTLAGLVLRWVAFLNAGVSFTHQIAEDHIEKHKLVTDGIYAYIRHPGYTGFFWYSVGTQILLGNPLCIPAFFYASYRFFKSRIEYEEELLESPKFFGFKYTAYKVKTPTYIPFIK